MEKNEAPMMVKVSTMKEFAKTLNGGKVNVSGDFAEALNNKVALLVTEAVRRAVDNKRGTIQPRDL